MNPINLIKSPGLQKILLAGTLVLLVWMIWKSNQRLREENQRLESNVRSLSVGLKQIQLENGALAGQSEVLTLRIQERFDFRNGPRLARRSPTVHNFNIGEFEVAH